MSGMKPAWRPPTPVPTRVPPEVPHCPYCNTPSVRDESYADPAARRCPSCDARNMTAEDEAWHERHIENGGDPDPDYEEGRRTGWLPGKVRLLDAAEVDMALYHLQGVQHAVMTLSAELLRVQEDYERKAALHSAQFKARLHNRGRLVDDLSEEEIPF